MEDGKDRKSSSPSSIFHLPSSSLRYAILWHTDIEEPHYDLMFETTPGSALSTWRSPIWPITSTTPLQKLRDHRRAFLNFHGSLTGDRGSVIQIATGDCEIQIDEKSGWTISAVTFPAPLHLKHVQDDSWEASAGAI